MILAERANISGGGGTDDVLLLQSEARDILLIW